MANNPPLETDNRWGRLLQTSFDEIYVFDASTMRFVQISDGALKNLGYSPDKILTMTPVDIKPDVSNEGFEKLISPLRDGQKQVVVFETVHQRKDGSKYPVEVRLQLAKEETPPVFIAIILDITDRLKAQHVADKSAHLFQTLARVSPVGIFRTDTQGHCIYANERWIEMAGIPLQQAMGEGWANAIHPNDRQWVFKEWYKAAQSKQHFRVEFRFMRPDGKVTWVLAEAAEELDSEGKHVGYVGNVTDISEHKYTEEALAKSIAEWVSIMDYFEDAIVLVDLEDKIFRANKPFYTLTGLTSEQVIGENPSLIFHPDGGGEHCPVCLARIERRDCRIVFEANSPDNQHNFPVEKIVRVVRNEKGDAQSILVVTKNLTRQRAIEDELRGHRDHLEELVSHRTRELESSNKELESYSYSIAHDLRSPLRSITGFSQIVREDYGQHLDEEGKEYLQRVIDSGKHMSEIIDDILELSRVNRVDFEKKSVDLTAISERYLRQLQDSAPRLDIQVSVEPGLMAQGDPKLIDIMLMNLIGNAWKYTSKVAHSQIDIGKTKKEGEMVFFVRDNGVGFDMAYAGKLFGVFQRMHKPGEFEGTGIGLATVQRIVARHGGRTWAEAAPNKGATFYFTLQNACNLTPELETSFFEDKLGA